MRVWLWQAVSNVTEFSLTLGLGLTPARFQSLEL